MQRSKLTWSELKPLVLEKYSPESIALVADVLREHHYERIATVPAERSVLSGLVREPVLILNNLWGSDNRLFTMSAFPTLHRLIKEMLGPGLGYLYRVMFLNEWTTRPELRRYFPDPLLDRLIETSALVQENERCQFTLSFFPFNEWILIRDCFYAYRRGALESSQGRVWLGADSISFAHFLHRTFSGRRIPRALEIGVGTGIQTLIAAQYADQAYGVDINQRAVAFARINAQINGIQNVEVHQSNLFEAVEGRFDVILANPWYCELKSGGLEEIPGIVDGMDAHLTEDGVLLMLINSYFKAGQDTVLVRLKEFLKVRGNYDLDIEMISYGFERERYQQFKQLDISHTIRYFAILRKGGTGQIRRRDVSFPQRVRDFSHIQLSKTLESIRG